MVYEGVFRKGIQEEGESMVIQGANDQEGVFRRNRLEKGGEGDKTKKMRWDGCQRKERGWKRTTKHIPWYSEVGDNSTSNRMLISRKGDGQLSCVGHALYSLQSHSLSRDPRAEQEACGGKAE